MGSRKSMKLPIVITFTVIVVIVYLFVNIKQTTITCRKNNNFFNEVTLKEEVVAILDSKKINDLTVTKKITLSPKYSKNKKNMEKIKAALDRTLEYLGDKVKYTIDDDSILVKIKVSGNEVVLLDNIGFVLTNDFDIIVDSNTKSGGVVTLTVGDNYTDGDFMKSMKKVGYSCK